MNLRRVSMVVVSNPCNPTGVAYDLGTLRDMADACKEHGAWFVVDNTYEDFLYGSEGDAAHACLDEPHIVNLFSFSKVGLVVSMPHSFSSEEVCRRRLVFPSHPHPFRMH